MVLLLYIVGKRLMRKSILHNWAVDGHYAVQTWIGKCEENLPKYCTNLGGTSSVAGVKAKPLINMTLTGM